MMLYRSPCKEDLFLSIVLMLNLISHDLREYDTVARADNYFAEYRMLFLRCRGNERDIFEMADPSSWTP